MRLIGVIVAAMLVFGSGQSAFADQKYSLEELLAMEAICQKNRLPITCILPSRIPPPPGSNLCSAADVVPRYPGDSAYCSGVDNDLKRLRDANKLQRERSDRDAATIAEQKKADEKVWLKQMLGQ